MKRERFIHDHIFRKRPRAYTRQQAFAEMKAEDAAEDDDELTPVNELSRSAYWLVLLAPTAFY
jgi:hypothetical protein